MIVENVNMAGQKGPPTRRLPIKITLVVIPSSTTDITANRFPFCKRYICVLSAAAAITVFENTLVRAAIKLDRYALINTTLFFIIVTLFFFCSLKYAARAQKRVGQHTRHLGLFFGPLSTLESMRWLAGRPA